MVFISYKHGEPWGSLANDFREALEVYAPVWGLEIFFDDQSMVAGHEWSAAIGEVLDEARYFVAFLCNRYWLSKECRRELEHAVGRYHDGKQTRLLFVLAEPMKPALLILDRSGDPKTLVTRRNASRVGDLLFLGPYENGTLTALARSDAEARGVQIAAMLDRLEKALLADGVIQTSGDPAPRL